MEPKHKIIAVCGGLLMVIAVLVLFLLRTPGRLPFKGESNTSQQQAQKSGGSASGGSGGLIDSGSTFMQPGASIEAFRGRDALELLEEWLSHVTAKDTVNVGALFEAMFVRLHQEPNHSAFYRRAQEILDDNTVDVAVRQALIQAMDRAAAPEAIQLLAEWSQNTRNPILRQAAYMAIGNTGGVFWEKESFQEVAPILAKLWEKAEDPDLQKAVASAMAQVGEPSCVTGLLETVMKQKGTLADIEQSRDARVSASWSSLQRLQNPDSIPVLQKQLQSGANALEISVCSVVLAQIGQVEASKALLSWAQNAGDKYAPVVHDAFARIPNAECLEYVNSVLAQNAPFKSNGVRKAVASAVKR